MRFKRLGASLLTGALSLSMLLAPSIPALAYTADGRAVDTTYEVGDLFIDKDENVVAYYTKEQLKEMKENNTKEYRDLKDKIGGEPIDELEKTKIAGKVYYVYTETIYKNTLTGKTSKDSDDITTDKGMPKTVAINTGAFYELELKFANGNVGIKNLKTSKTNIATAVIASQHQDITNKKERVSRDPSKKNKYYYYDAYGKKIYVKAGTVINSSSGSVRIRIKGLKSGTSKMTFNIVDKDGKVTKKNQAITIKVNATQPFAKLTYAGKNIIKNPVVGALDKDYLYYGLNTDTDASNNSSLYTTTAKGKLSVKMNKNYKLMKIEVGSLYEEKYTTYTRNSNKSTYFKGKKLESQYTDEEQFNEYNGTIKSEHYYDLNGDGDFLDIVNGIKETDVSYKFKTIRNNSTVKLSKITGDTITNSKIYNDSAWTYELERDAAGNAVKDENDNYKKVYTLLDKNDFNLYKKSSSSMYAPTNLRITYYDKTEKSCKLFNTTIWYRVSKK